VKKAVTKAVKKATVKKAKKGEDKPSQAKAARTTKANPAAAAGSEKKSPVKKTPAEKPKKGAGKAKANPTPVKQVINKNSTNSKDLYGGRGSQTKIQQNQSGKLACNREASAPTLALTLNLILTGRTCLMASG
jgi:hypothetical protein